jgi:hypothetical protein
VIAAPPRTGRRVIRTLIPAPAGPPAHRPVPQVDSDVDAVLGGHARAAVVSLLARSRAEGWRVDLVETAVGGLAGQALLYRSWWAGAQVSRDRAVRAASARALDCAEHGTQIAELERQLHHADGQYRSAERCRRAYVEGLHNLTTALTGLRFRVDAGDPDLPSLGRAVDILAALVAAIEKAARWR